MDNTVKGFCNRWVSATSFGLIPLFSIPVMTGAVSMQTPSILFYRFTFGCLGILAVLLWKRTDLRLDRTEMMEIAVLALFYDVEALLMILGYQYMPSGPATTLVFSYPIWTEILMLVFFHERFSWATILAMSLAFAGVACMSGLGSEGHTHLTGVVIELMAGLCYSFYMVAMSHMRVRRMGSLKLTFYVFLFGLIMFAAFATLFTGGIEPISNGSMLFNLMMLGLVCTALSNVMLIPAVEQIGATLTAILGAFEPLTAMVVSLLVFGDHLTPPIILGFLFIIVAVMVLIITKMHLRRPNHALFRRSH